MTTKQQRKEIFLRIAEQYSDPHDILEAGRELGIDGRRAQTALFAATGIRTVNRSTRLTRAIAIINLIARENAKGRTPVADWIVKNSGMAYSRAKTAIRCAESNGDIERDENGYHVVD